MWCQTSPFSSTPRWCCFHTQDAISAVSWGKGEGLRIQRTTTWCSSQQLFVLRTDESCHYGCGTNQGTVELQWKHLHAAVLHEFKMSRSDLYTNCFHATSGTSNRALCSTQWSAKYLGSFNSYSVSSAFLFFFGLLAGAQWTQLWTRNNIPLCPRLLLQLCEVRI